VSAARRRQAPPPDEPPDESIVPPHSLEAERSTLGAAIMDRKAADYVVDHLVDASYYRKAHAQIFTAIRALRQRSEDIDLITLKTELGARLDESGGPAYISALIDGVPRSSNVGHYCAILEDLRMKRALVAFGRDVIEHATSNTTQAPAIVQLADRRLLELQSGHSQGRMQSVRDSLPALVDDIERRMQHPGELTGPTTGFTAVNRETLGWQAGDLIIVAARPSIGKTTFVLNSAVAAATAGSRVAIFSLEMRRLQLEYRIMSQLTRIPLTQILEGRIMQADMPRMTEAIAEISALPIEIDDTTGRTSWDIRSACRRMKADGGLDLVIVDYVQLMAGSLENRNASRTEQMTDISRRMKTLADEGGFPVILLSQLSRAGEGRTDPRPKLSDLRESGSLEQDADIVAFLHRKHHREGGLTEFILEKQRNGPTGTVLLHLERDTTTFTDAAADAVIPEPTAVEKQEARKVKQVNFFKQKARR
jgi:replicative DNA helicase